MIYQKLLIRCISNSWPTKLSMEDWEMIILLWMKAWVKKSKSLLVLDKSAPNNLVLTKKWNVNQTN